MAACVTAVWADRAEPRLPSPDGAPRVLMVTTPANTVRDEARALVRAALRSFLGQLAGCEEAAVSLHTEPGQAPRLDALPGATHLALHLSISHETGLSLAAIRSGGRVGVDLMRAADAAMPDWHDVAQDYLGPDTAAGLLRLDDEERPAAFARAWTRHEAALKCLGRQLEEWSPGLAHELARCRVSELLLPAPYTGAVALCD